MTKVSKRTSKRTSKRAKKSKKKTGKKNLGKKLKTTKKIVTKSIKTVTKKTKTPSKQFQKRSKPAKTPKLSRMVKGTSKSQKKPSTTKKLVKTKSTNKEAMIFIPGAMGSKLVRKGYGFRARDEVLWPTENGPTLKKLKLTRSGSSPDVRTIVPTKSIRSFIFPFANKFFSYFEDKGYRENVLLFDCAYDWRIDMDDAAKLLYEKIDLLTKSKKDKGGGFSKVILIGYSLGGLVIRSFLSRYKNTKMISKVSKIFFLGAPHRSIPKYLYVLMTGKEAPVPTISKKTIKEVTSNFTGLYQGVMDPIYDEYSGGVVKKGKDKIEFSEFNAEIENRYNDSMIKKAIKFNKKLAVDWDTKPFKNSYLLVGKGIETITRISLNKDRKISPIKDSSSDGGDGTVPYFSAIRLGQKRHFIKHKNTLNFMKKERMLYSSSQVKEVYVFQNTNHSEIYQHDAVLQTVIDIIQKKHTPIKPPKTPKVPSNGHPSPLPVLDLRNKSDGGNGPLQKSDLRKQLVEDLQIMLKELGYDLGTYGLKKDGVDKIFGDKTERAVRQFQASNKDHRGKKLVVDGFVGSLTSDSINRKLKHWYPNYKTPKF